MNPKIFLIDKTYSELEPPAEVFGNFVPAHIMDVGLAFQKLIDLKIVEEGQFFLDTGSGDGRIIAVAAAFGFKAFGVEINEELLRYSEKIINKLESEEVIPKGMTTSSKGDFFNADAYQKTKFSEFKVIFNYVTEAEMLVEKISKESPTGTILIIYNPEGLEVDNEKLKRLEVPEEFNVMVFEKI